MKTDYSIIFPQIFNDEVNDLDLSGLVCSNDKNNFVARGTISIRLENGKEITATGEHGAMDYREYGFILIPSTDE